MVEAGTSHIYAAFALFYTVRPNTTVVASFSPFLVFLSCPINVLVSACVVRGGVATAGQIRAAESPPSSRGISSARKLPFTNRSCDRNQRPVRAADADQLESDAVRLARIKPTTVDARPTTQRAGRPFDLVPGGQPVASSLRWICRAEDEYE